MSRQTTLFGGLASKDRVVYRDPRTSYEKFVNKFVEGDKRRKEDSVKAANAAWNSDGYRDSPGKLASYLASAEKADAVDLDYGFRRLTSSKECRPERISEQTSVTPKSATPSIVDVSAVGSSVELKVSFNKAAISSCLQKLDVDESKLLSEDVVDVSLFMSSLESFSTLYLDVTHCRRQYNSLLTRGSYAGSKTGLLLSDEDQRVSKLSQLLRDIAAMEIGSCRVGILQSGIEKSRLLTSAVADMQCVCSQMQELRRRLQIRTAQMLEECSASRLGTAITFQCLQSTTCSWEAALASVVDDLNSNAYLHGPLTYGDLISCGQLLRSTNAFPLQGVLDHCNKSSASHTGAANVLLERFPLLLLSQGSKQQVLVNLHELVINSQSLSDLLNLDKEIEESALGTACDLSASSQTASPGGRKKPPGPSKGEGGRPAHHVRYPTMVEEVASFIKLHSFTAQRRRRTDASSSMGVSLEEIRRHLFRVIPGLKDSGISVDTVHRLMLPPRQGTSRAQQLKGLVSAKVPKKRNDAVLHEHQDHHYCSSLVASVNELFEEFGELRVSCDDKNKINVGTPAVSHYHQISSFFMVGSSPNLPDHDFPYANSKIVPSGYLVMHGKRRRAMVPGVARSRSLSPTLRNKRGRYGRLHHSAPPGARSVRQKAASKRSRSVPAREASRPKLVRSSSEPRNTSSKSRHVMRFTSSLHKLDRLGRLHVVYSRTGSLYVVNRASRFQQSSAQSHANDLSSILRKELALHGKHSVCLITDNGPDYNMKSDMTLLYMGRLWRHCNLDILVQTSYAPGHSAHNMIEHAWAPLSRKLAGVTLPITIEGEDKPPCQQSGLSDEQRKAKEVQVFDEAIRTLNTFWHGKTYDSFLITSHGRYAEEGSAPYHDAAVVAKFLDSGIREIEQTEELAALQAELVFLSKHSIRSTSYLQFAKCTDTDCPHCSTRPVRSVNLVKFLRDCPGGHLPLPTPSVSHPGHFLTWLESKATVQAGQEKRLSGLDTAPSATSAQLCKRGCKWLLPSKSAAERHDLVLHTKERRLEQQQARRNQQKTPASEPRQQFACLFPLPDGTLCAFVGSSAHYLRQHKEKEGHSRKRKRH